jgi:hypothetical protein
MPTSPRHPPLTFSKSLPSHAHNKPDHIPVNGHKSTQTAEDKLRRKATIWRKDLAAVKKSKEDINFTYKGK